jgi:hypothetical protein
MEKDVYKRIIIASILVLVGIVMAIISWIILPEAVMMQFPGLQTGVPAFPKFLAILVAFGFTAVFSVFSVKQEEAVKYAFIGYVLHILYWICNL